MYCSFAVITAPLIGDCPRVRLHRSGHATRMRAYETARAKARVEGSFDTTLPNARPRDVRQEESTPVTRTRLSLKDKA
jgi:hypothetical protein